MARVRSPNFPIISLPQAITRIEVIYDSEQTVPADRATLANHLGYSGLNGASLKMISALGKYGLLEELPNKQFRVSKLAMTIMHPASEGEKMDAIREAARGPALFQKLTEQFEGQRPSETNLRSWLLRNGFAKSAVDSVTKAYGETMDLVGDSSRGYNAPAVSATPTTEKGKMNLYRPDDGAHTRPGVSHEVGQPFSVELLSDRFRVVGELTSKEDAQKLIDILNMAINILPANPKPEVERSRSYEADEPDA
jgi:hypothetical protein